MKIWAKNVEASNLSLPEVEIDFALHVQVNVRWTAEEKRTKLRIAVHKVSLKIKIDEEWRIQKTRRTSNCKRNTLILLVAPSGIWDLGSGILFWRDLASDPIFTMGSCPVLN